MFERIQRIRRELHQIPELELSLPMTKAYLISQLLDLPCQLDFPLESGITAFFDNGREETIAFRSDMDALPITERSDAPYRSRHEGNMHACGHDGHMAMLLGLDEPLCQKLAEELRDVWNARRPKDPYDITTYAKLQRGFRNVVLGIDITGWVRRQEGQDD